LIDETCPPEGVLAAVNQISAPKEVIILPHGDHHGADGSDNPYGQRCWGAWLPALRQGQPAPVKQ
jgi:cephalosporin-C deacetylase-like acetyl esterase